MFTAFFLFFDRKSIDSKKVRCSEGLLILTPMCLHSCNICLKLVEKVVNYLQKSSLSLLTAPDLLTVRKIERLLSLVQVDKVCDVETTECVHDVPRIVLGDVNLEQFHVLRPIMANEVVHNRT